MALIKIGLSGMPIPDKIQFARQVVLDMTGNANFTTPLPSLASITSAATALENAYNTAQTARQTAKSATSNQDAKNTALDLLLTQEANYVENTTAGDQTKIESAGFSVRNPAVPIGDLPAPQNLEVGPNENAGTANLSWDRVTGAKSYIVQRSQTPDTDGSWTNAGTPTKSKVIANTMVSGTRYYFRVAAVGAAGQGAWTDAVPIYAP